MLPETIFAILLNAKILKMEQHLFLFSTVGSICTTAVFTELKGSVKTTCYSMHVPTGALVYPYTKQKDSTTSAGKAPDWTEKTTRGRC